MGFVQKQEVSTELPTQPIGPITGPGPTNPKPVPSWPREGKAPAQDHTANTTHVAAASSLAAQLLTLGVGSVAQEGTAISSCTDLGLQDREFPGQGELRGPLCLSFLASSSGGGHGDGCLKMPCENYDAMSCEAPFSPSLAPCPALSTCLSRPVSRPHAPLTTASPSPSPSSKGAVTVTLVDTGQ